MPKFGFNRNGIHEVTMEKRLVLTFIFGVGAMFFQVPATYASILSGSVTQNGPLYTYSYMLDNTSGPGPISEVSVLVDYGNLQANVPPNSHADPVSWNFQMTFSGSIANPPYNELGSFWAWQSDSPLAVGQTLTGFSFTTNLAPTPSTSNNYFLFCPTSSCGSDGVVEYGHIIAPQIGAQTVPEPSFFWPVLLLMPATVLSKRFSVPSRVPARLPGR